MTYNLKCRWYAVLSDSLLISYPNEHICEMKVVLEISTVPIELFIIIRPEKGELHI